LAANDAVVLCLVQNGENYVQSFIRHYLSLGFKHIFFLDNGSSDRTVELVKAHAEVTVLRSRLSFRRFKREMRDYLFRTYCRRRWGLNAEIDEFFDYWGSEWINIQQLTGFLSRFGFTAVTMQMLDMFSDRTLTELDSRPSDDLATKYRYYEMSDLMQWSCPAQRCEMAFESNECPYPEIRHYYGGVKKRVFGLDSIWLSKHALRYGDGKLPMDGVHTVENARIADFTAILRHYKFLSGFPEQVERAVVKKNYSSDSYKYRKYAETLRRNPSLTLVSENSQLYEGCEALVKQGYLYASSAFADFVRQNLEHVTK
jgi:glycosyltransferase involved in cell wall biosynthesis